MTNTARPWARLAHLTKCFIVSITGAAKSEVFRSTFFGYFFDLKKLKMSETQRIINGKRQIMKMLLPAAAGTWILPTMPGL